MVELSPEAVFDFSTAYRSLIPGSGVLYPNRKALIS
jgi:hypothetical protein